LTTKKLVTPSTFTNHHHGDHSEGQRRIPVDAERAVARK